MPHTYCGLVDDFAVRHRDGRPISTVPQLNQVLIRAAVIGDPLLINDGYVLMNPAIRRAIQKPSTSPFRNLVECGFVRILSRTGGDLASVADHMAAQGTTTAIQMTADPAYAQYEDDLADWSSGLNVGWRTWHEPWPGHWTHPVFAELGAMVLDALEERDAHTDQIRAFRDELGSASDTRTRWEDVATAMVLNGRMTRPTRRHILLGANEAYQYAWGRVLMGEDRPVRVQTRAPRYLGWLDRVEPEASPAARGPIHVAVPNMGVIQEAVDGRWSMLANAVQSPEVQDAKQRFLELSNLRLAGADVEDAEVRDAGKAYSRELAKHFGRDNAVSRGVVILGAALNIAALAAPLELPASVVGWGLVVAGVTPELPPVHEWLLRFGRTKPTKWLRAADAASIGTSSSFELDPVKIRSLAALQPVT